MRRFAEQARDSPSEFAKERTSLSVKRSKPETVEVCVASVTSEDETYIKTLVVYILLDKKYRFCVMVFVLLKFINTFKSIHRNRLLL